MPNDETVAGPSRPSSIVLRTFVIDSSFVIRISSFTFPFHGHCGKIPRFVLPRLHLKAILPGVFMPLLLVFLAVLSAGVVAYGTNAFWAQYPHGIELILWSRRLEWPLVTLSLLLCLVLLGLIVAGKRRAWWLIGLGPVLALFAHHYLADPAASYFVVEGPTFVSAEQAPFLADGDYVVGLRFGDAAYAYPYAVLFHDPVVIHSDHDKRLMLMWSAFANRAVAQRITRDLKARDLEIVSTPANALLLYDRGSGQFINALKGQTMDGRKPIGFGPPVALSTMTWKDWHALNPQTQVMVLRATGGPNPIGLRPSIVCPLRALMNCPEPRS